MRYYRLWHHRHDSAAWYFEWKEQGIVGRIVHYIVPSPVAAAWLVAVVAVCAAVAATTMAIEFPGGW